MITTPRRDRGTIYTRLDARTVCNNHRVKVEGFAETHTQVMVSVEGPGRFELFGSDTIDLAEHDASWLPYRVCGSDIEPRRSILTFKFEGRQAAASRETTFLTQRR